MLGSVGRRGSGRHRIHPVGEDVTRRRAGDPIVRGRLIGLEGRFRLAAGLSAPGALSVTEAVGLVVAEMRAQAAAGLVTVDVIATTYEPHLRSFAKYMTARGATTVSAVTVNLVVEWIVAPSAAGPAPRSVQVARRSAARGFFNLCARLGLYDQNPAIPVEIGGKYNRHVSRYTDGQIAHLKGTACYRERETRVPASIALLLCGVLSGETGSIQVGHVDLTGWRIAIPEAGSQFVRARTVPIRDQWCHDALSARARALQAEGQSDTAWLVYQGASDDAGARNSAVSNVVTEALKRACLYDAGVYRIASITEWVAADAFRATGDLAYVANLLGMSSLDAAANLVGHDWTTTDVPAVTRLKPQA